MAILAGQVYINDTDIYTEFGAFLSEQRKGAKENSKSIFTPSKLKKQVAVDFREKPGEKYPKNLMNVNEARDVTLTFCIYAKTKADWLSKYKAFITFIKAGWLDFYFPSIDHRMRMFYKSCSGFSPISYIWVEGVQAAHFKIVFREPSPTF